MAEPTETIDQQGSLHFVSVKICSLSCYSDDEWRYLEFWFHRTLSYSTGRMFYS